MISIPNRQLGRQLTPRPLDLVDELPRLPTGKLYEQELRARLAGAGDSLRSRDGV